MKAAGFVVLGLLALTGVTHAQMLRGMGRLQGRVADESGAALPDVSIKATLLGASGSVGVSTDKKGEWNLVGIGRGEWELTFEKPGYATRKAKATLDVELARLVPISVSLRKTP